MSIAFKIAWRNIFRHKGKSLVIGTIIFIGTLLMTLGDGVISGLDRGFSQNIVNLFTGDIVIVSDEQENDSVIFTQAGKNIEVLDDYKKIKDLLIRQNYIEKFLPVTSGMVFVFNPDGDMGNTKLLGVDFEKYQKMFPNNIKLLSGRLLKSDERGLLVSAESRKQAYDYLDLWLIPKDVEVSKDDLPEDIQKNYENIKLQDNLVFMGASTSNTTLDIRTPILGIFKYKALNKLWGKFNIIDIESYRECFNYITASAANESINKEEKELLNLENDNIDDLFSENSMFEEEDIGNNEIAVETVIKETKRTKKKIDTDDGAYNLVFIKLKDNTNLTKSIKILNQKLDETNLNARAISWKDASGIIGNMATIFKISLNIITLFIFFVAIIIIMNTLSMAAIERISEIGMMRAVGALKGFVRKMFVYETAILSFLFGSLGIVTGIVIILIIQKMNIYTDNAFLQLLYGGETFYPVVLMNDIIIELVQLGLVTLMAVLYPLRVVGRITPLDAITRE